MQMPEQCKEPQGGGASRAGAWWGGHRAGAGSGAGGGRARRAQLGLLEGWRSDLRSAAFTARMKNRKVGKDGSREPARRRWPLVQQIRSLD